MASDSAVTVKGRKAFNGVKKIFNIKEDIPIALMVNGPLYFCGLSLEKLLDEFKCYDFEGVYTVENVKNNFITFLESIIDNIDLDEFIDYHLIQFKKFLKDEFDGIVEIDFDLYMHSFEKREIYPFLKDLNISFEDVIPDFVKNKKEVNEVLLSVFSHHIFSQSSEIIIAGFDEITKTKSFICFRLITKIKNEIIYDIVDFRINIQNPIILSFGDDGEVQMFLNGILPEFENFLIQLFKLGVPYYLNSMLSLLFEDMNLEDDVILKLKDKLSNLDKYNRYIFDEIRDEIDYYKYERSTPLFELTDSLPESILIDLAIFLINFTSNKRKFSLDVENVGGNVSLALMKPDCIKFFTSDDKE